MTAPIRRRTRRGHGPVAVFAVTLSVAGVACSDDSGTTPAPSTTVVAGSSTTVPADDGVLRIGVLLPTSGAGAPLGEPLVDAIQLGVAEVNQAGGVNGEQVELVLADEGDAMAAATKAAAELLEADVDAVIGPASSRIALTVLGSLVDAGVFTCSPTATAIALSSFPDDRLFVRTVGSDALQATAMAEVIEGAGVGSAAVMAPNDDYGRSYAEAVAQALRKRGITVTSEILYEESEDEYATAVFQALELDPGAIAFIGNSVSGRPALATLDELVPTGLPVVVNDALRRATAVDANPLIPAHADITGTSPRTTPSPSGAPWFSPVFAAFLGIAATDLPASYAANAYDCVSLITTAAEAGDTNDASTIAANVIGVSGGGASCNTFAACRQFLEERRNIDLNGASGQLELDTTGDVTIAWFDRFRFDGEGRDVTVGELQVSA